MEVSSGHSPLWSLNSHPSPSESRRGLADSPCWPDRSLAPTRGLFSPHLSPTRRPQCLSHRLLRSGWALHSWSHASVQIRERVSVTQGGFTQTYLLHGRLQGLESPA